LTAKTHIGGQIVFILFCMNNATFLKLAPLIVFLLISSVHIVRAQDYYESTYQYKPVSLGITVSPSLSWLRYGDDDGYESTSKFGFAYGLAADFGISENYYFATGLWINTLNSEVNGGSGATGDTRKYRLQYAEIPLSVKLKSTQRYFRSYYGQFGFTTSFKLSGRESVDGGRSASMGSGANFLRLGLLIGGGVEWQLDHNLTLATGLSFNNGFTRAVKRGEPKNSYLGLTLGIFF